LFLEDDDIPLASVDFLPRTAVLPVLFQGAAAGRLSVLHQGLPAPRLGQLCDHLGQVIAVRVAVADPEGVEFILRLS
jgi:hypothetical protein